MPYKLLFVSHSADWMGPTKSLLILLAQLVEHYDVAVLTPGRGRFTAELDRAGIRVLDLPSLTKWRLPAMAGMVRRERFDLVYANNTRSPARLAFLAARAHGRPFICHVRAMEWDKSWSQLGYLRFADAVVAVSAACADSISRFVRSGRLHVAHNGVPLARLDPVDQGGPDLRRSLGLPADAIVLLGLAHLCPRKGQHLALEALARVRLRFPNAHLCLAGSMTRDPDYVAHLRQRTEALGLDERVHFLGFRDDVGTLLGGADLLVHTAVADPHPRSVIEAMAAGTPVVAFAVDGVAETVEDGRTGRLAPPGDVGKLAELLISVAGNPDSARAMGAAGRKRVEAAFSAEATARRVQAIIDGVLGVRRQAPGLATRFPA